MDFFRAKAQPAPPRTDLEQSVNSLKADMRGLRLEWESTYDKLMKVVSRLNARHRRAAAEEPKPPTGEPPEAAGHQEHQGTHALLAGMRARRTR